MKVRWVAFIALAGCVYLIINLNKNIKTELAPLEDRSIIRSGVTAPEGTDYDYMEKLVAKISKLSKDSVPEATMVFGITSPGFTGAGGSANTGFVSVRLSDPDERQASQQQIYDRLSRIYKRIPEARIFPNQEQTISTSMAARTQLPVQFVLQNLDFNKIAEVLPKFMEAARANPVFGNVDVNLKFNKPEIQISIDRIKAAGMGVSMGDISSTLQLALSGRRFGYFLRNGKQYQVIGQVDRENRDAPSDLTSLYVRNKQGQLIQLSNFVKMEESSNPPTLFHFNRYKSATLQASLAPGRTLGEGIVAMQEIAKKLLDESFHTSLSGPSRDFQESASNTSFAFILALLLIYLILAAQFESFRDPFIIMLTVPLALAGAFISLWWTGQTLNIFSQIGMIMLIGLVTKNGILIVEFANHQRETGVKKLTAVVDAAVSRLRPILMTTLATVLGALPIAVAFGSGAKSRIPLGVVVVGGLLFSLLLTLYIIPAMYSFLSGKKKVRKEAEQEEKKEVEN